METRYSLLERFDPVLHCVIVGYAECGESGRSQHPRVLWISAHLVRAEAGGSAPRRCEEAFQVSEDDLAPLQQWCNACQCGAQIARVAAVETESHTNGGIAEHYIPYCD
jgi:hypothetical protein